MKWIKRAFVVFVVLVGLRFVVLPGLLRAKMSGNETSAISTLRAVSAAEDAYAAGCGKGGYAATLAVLAESSSDSQLRDLVATKDAVRSGFRFSLTTSGAMSASTDCKGRETRTHWYASAVPTSFNTTGTRSFAASQGHGVWQSTTASAPSEPYGPPSTQIQ